MVFAKDGIANEGVTTSTKSVRRTTLWARVRRLIGVLLVGLMLVVGCVTIATVEISSSSRDIPAQLVPNEVWPARGEPHAPEVTVQSGSGPTDHGPFELCRVMENFRTDEIEGYMLVSTVADPRIRVTSGFNWASGGENPSVHKVHLNNQTILLAFVMPSSREHPIGTMYYFASSNGLAKQEQKFLGLACDAGWHVIAMTIDLTFGYSQQLPLGEGGEIGLALRIDNHLADRAFALESFNKYLETERPELLLRPTVFVGLSAGAIALPTVAARTGPPDAAVFVAGGQNVAEIILTSPLCGEHTKLVHPTEADADNEEPIKLVTDSLLRAEFAKNVFNRCRLDPAKTASVLSSTPTLMLHANYDRIVPAHMGDALYNSLGRPERWSYRIGHIGLCAMLPWKAKHILRWLEEKTVDSRESG